MSVIEAEPVMDKYASRLYKLLSSIECDQKTFSEGSDEYKNLQYLYELLDVCYGSCESFDGTQRQYDLELTKTLINKIEVII